MKQIYCLDQSLSLDESMVLCRGRLIFRQYMKNSRHKHRVKFYELCDLSLLILRGMIFSEISYPDPDSARQTGGIVMNLIENFIGKGYIIFSEDFYNTANVTKQMSSNGTKICETFRADRNNIHKNFFWKNLEKGKWFWAWNETTVVCK